MAREWQESFFFIHVMKTAGMTLNGYGDANFTPEQRFPTNGDAPTDYMVIDPLRAAVKERRDQVRLWRGHYPWFVTDLVPEARTFTLLREPVARTLSLIAQHQVNVEPDMSLEEIYDDPYVFERMIVNHQTKIFSLTEADQAGIYLHVIDTDRARLDVAKANLERVDLLGVQEQFPRMLADLEHRFGWNISPIESVNIGGEIKISESFRRRIADDNALDAELYEHALKLLGEPGGDLSH